MAFETLDSGMNPYAAPASRVDEVTVVSTVEPVFFPVSLLKLALMCIATLGIYQLYWFYRNWKCVVRLGEDVNAPIRSFFYALTSYTLFRRIRDRAKTAEIGTPLEAGTMAIVVWLLAAAGNLPEPYWVITWFSFLPLLHVQAVVNEINQKLAPGADKNDRLSGWNIAALVVGALLVVLAVIGLLAP